VNARQRRFAECYVRHHNATTAAIEAGYSEKRARVTGSELLRKPDVAQLVAELDAETAASLGIDHEHVTKMAMAYAMGGLHGRLPASSGVRALEMLAEMAGILNPRPVTSPSWGDQPVVYTLALDRELNPEDFPDDD
jgi:phage terminase small subunit